MCPTKTHVTNSFVSLISRTGRKKIIWDIKTLSPNQPLKKKLQQKKNKLKENIQQTVFPGVVAPIRPDYTRYQNLVTKASEIF